MNKTIAARMGDAAMNDAALPYSLMCDAWDALAALNCSTARGYFNRALSGALDAYEANPAGYWTDERKARVRAANERTCAFPGDHEHDHEMCRDAVIEA